ncbi:aldo/keto reductase [Streptomyces avidinii]
MTKNENASDMTTARRALGSTGPTVFPLGLGCMGMSALYGEADRAESIATIHAYLEATPAGTDALLDTGDFYGMGHNELLINEALRTAPTAARERALTSVKFGALRTVEGGFTGYDGRPEAVKNFLAYSLQRLGRDHIDIYRIARVDPDVPIEETVGAIAEAVAAGHVRHIGLSEVGADTLRRAAAVAPISDLQIEYSLISRGIEDEILPAARELGIGITAYGVLSRGLISGHFTRDRALAPGVTGLFGLLCLATLFAPRPLMFYFGRKFATDGTPESTAWWNGLWQYEGFRTTMNRMTLVWGLAYVAEALVRVFLAYTLSTGTMVVVSPIMIYGVLGALGVWTAMYGKRSQAEGERRAAEAAAAEAEAAAAEAEAAAAS